MLVIFDEFEVPADILDKMADEQCVKCNGSFGLGDRT